MTSQKHRSHKTSLWAITFHCRASSLKGNTNPVFEHVLATGDDSHVALTETDSLPLCGLIFPSFSCSLLSSLLFSPENPCLFFMMIGLAISLFQCLLPNHALGASSLLNKRLFTPERNYATSLQAEAAAVSHLWF